MMTEHNKIVIDKMIKDLGEERLKLFRLAANLDETIRTLEACAYTHNDPQYVSTSIKGAAKDRDRVLKLNSEDRSVAIMCEALGKLE